jgi:hypothetical protein
MKDRSRVFGVLSIQLSCKNAWISHAASVDGNPACGRKGRWKSDSIGWGTDQVGQDARSNRQRKRKRPRLSESWDTRRTALPRSLLTTSLTAGMVRGNGSDGPL